MKKWEEWIVSDPAVMLGKPVIAGTRITVELILEKLAEGETVEALLEAHPRLTYEAIQAALAFAAEALRAEEGRTDRRDAQAPDCPQCDGQKRHDLEPSTRPPLSYLSFALDNNTVARR